MAFNFIAFFVFCIFVFNKTLTTSPFGGISVYRRCLHVVYTRVYFIAERDIHINEENT